MPSKIRTLLFVILFFAASPYLHASFKIKQGKPYAITTLSTHENQLFQNTAPPYSPSFIKSAKRWPGRIFKNRQGREPWSEKGKKVRLLRIFSMVFLILASVPGALALGLFLLSAGVIAPLVLACAGLSAISLVLSVLARSGIEDVPYAKQGRYSLALGLQSTNALIYLCFSIIALLTLL